MRYRLKLSEEFMMDYSHATHAKFASICGKAVAGYLAPDLECVCGYKFFERKEES